MKKISILGVLIGFMLKVIKTNQKIDQKFNSLFIELRHGNYDNFLNLANSYGIAQHPPYMVIYNDGIIYDNQSTPVTQGNNCDFANLLSNSNTYNFLITELKKKFRIQDIDITDDYYNKFGEYEISLRMHFNNENLSNGRIKINLEEIIDELCSCRNLSDKDKCDLHKGRTSLNEIKHGLKKNRIWLDCLSDFDSAWNVCIKNNILVI